AILTTRCRWLIVQEALSPACRPTSLYFVLRLVITKFLTVTRGFARLKSRSFRFLLSRTVSVLKPILHQRKTRAIGSCKLPKITCRLEHVRSAIGSGASLARLPHVYRRSIGSFPLQNVSISRRPWSFRRYSTRCEASRDSR